MKNSNSLLEVLLRRRLAIHLSPWKNRLTSHCYFVNLNQKEKTQVIQELHAKSASWLKRS
jgi:hypothetical protein